MNFRAGWRSAVPSVDRQSDRAGRPVVEPVYAAQDLFGGHLYTADDAVQFPVRYDGGIDQTCLDLEFVAKWQKFAQSVERPYQIDGQLMSEAEAFAATACEP